MNRISKAWPSTAVALAALACISTAHADGAAVTQMTDGSSASAAALVNAMLGTNSGVAVVAGSAQYVGAASASGTYANGGLGASGLGIDSGVVLTSGDARFIGSSAAFPGDSSNQSGDFTAGFGNSLTVNSSPGNSLLDALTTSGTQNASILSFQFVPTRAALTMTFVFGSEDYNDLVNAGFPNDVFGIFVNGVNYALVPGTNSPISAATINCGGPTSSFAPGGGVNCALYRDNPAFSENIISELDGMTTAITLSMPVNAGAVNSISIGIADSLDDVGDSALMIQAGSVVAVPEPSSYALLLGGLGVLGFVARKRRG